MSRIDYYDILGYTRVIKTQPYQLIGREMEASMDMFSHSSGSATMTLNYIAQDGTELTVKKRVYDHTARPEELIHLPINL